MARNAKRFGIRANTNDALRDLIKLKKGMSLAAQDLVIRKVAFIAHRKLVQATPKGFTGNTRRQWRIFRRGVGRYTVTNTSKVMHFLEEGTRAHGAKKPGGKLFIPLNRRTALAGPKKVFQANQRARRSGRGRRRRKPPFKRGVDFLYVDRVRGIRAKHIVKQERDRIKPIFQNEMRKHVRRVIRNG